MPKHSLILVGPAHPFRGGIAQFTDELGATLQRRGNRITILSFSRQYPGLLFPGQTQFSDEPAEQELDTRRIIDTINPITWVRAAREAARLKPGLVLFQYWLPFMAPAYGTMAGWLRRSGISTAALVHNALPHERRTGDARLSRYFLSRCEAAVTLSASVAQDVRLLAPSIRLVEEAHPPYRHFGDPMLREDARRALGLDPADRVLLFFGFIRKYKGLGVLLKAVAEAAPTVGRLRLLVAGEFYEDRQPYLDQISQHGLSDHVQILDGYHPNDSVRRLFSASDVVVQPYLHATQSGVAAIATQLERPMIVTRVGGLAENVEGRGLGLVVAPNDAGALAEAIRRFFADGLEAHFAPAIRRTRERGWDDLAERVEEEADRQARSSVVTI
jgi:D-inositol-3-phosphate glycosyltransferase